MSIYRNKHPAGRFNSFTFGLCNIGDGLVRVLTFGFFHSTFALDHARSTAKRRIEKFRREFCK
jgi:hypothetical protein